MAKMNALQEQLHKAGLAKKSKVASVAREQDKAPSGPSEVRRDAERVRQEKVERDRAFAAERKTQALAHELRAQARQIISDRKLPRKGEREYRFTAHGAIRTLLIDDDDQARQLASGALVIAAVDERFELLPRAAGDQVRQRDAAMIVVNHGQPSDMVASGSAEDDAYYAQFKVPDDLLW